MGYNTTLMILNDHLSSIKEDPNFGRKLAEAVQRLWGSNGNPVDFGSGKAIETHHADELMAVVVGGNLGRTLGHAGSHRAIRLEGDDMFNILSALAEEHGFVLRRRVGLSLINDQTIYKKCDVCRQSFPKGAESHYTCPTCSGKDYSHLVGEICRTPFEPSGRVLVIEIEAEDYDGKQTALIRYVEDHPRGYRQGDVGRYFAHELVEISN